MGSYMSDDPSPPPRGTAETTAGGTRERCAWLVGEADAARDRLDTGSARRGYEEAVALARALVERDPDDVDAHRHLSIAGDRLADLDVLLGNAEPALARCEEAVAVARALLERWPNHAQARRDLSVSLNKLGDLQIALGSRTQARRAFEEALEIRRLLADREPDGAQAQRDLAVSTSKLGDVHAALGEGELARRAYEDALPVFRGLAEQRPDDVDAHGDLALAFERMASVDVEGALEWLGQAVGVHRRRLALEPGNVIVQRELGVSLVQLAEASVTYGEGEGAVAAFREAYALLRPLRDRGALEAQYHGVVDQLVRLFELR
jgi:tetratricopeptide (TPR) repeat protein